MCVGKWFKAIPQFVKLHFSFPQTNLMECSEARDEFNSYQLAAAQPTIARNAIMAIPMISFSTNGVSCTHFLCGAERE